MSQNPIFLLDTNVFIQSSQRYYAFDIAPGFWEELISYAELGRVMSIDKVKKELISERIKNWSTEYFQKWFESTNEPDVINAYQKIIRWAFAHDYTDKAKEDFSNIADSWLIAFSYAKKYTLVTEETYNENCKKRIKIPNICREFSIRYINTFQMLRELNIKWEKK
jgi:hypothetical protein